MENWSGFCPICRQQTEFRAVHSWYRDALCCTTCEGGSVPRERALALVLEEQIPHWRNLAIHESSPSEQGISLKLRRQAPGYVASHYRPEHPTGHLIEGFRNEDLQNLTFPDEAHDVFVSLDVFEHIRDPKQALSEIFRTLKPGGIMLSTFPVRKNQLQPIDRRVDYGSDGSVNYIKEPEYHGNPVDPAGSIVTVDYGYDVHLYFSEIAGFNVRVYRFADRWHGIVGEYTEVIMCQKPHFKRADGLPHDFDAHAYLNINKDVAAANIDAAEHYINFGRSEGRSYKYHTLRHTDQDICSG